MQQFLIYVLTVRPYFRSIEVEDILVELEPFNFFMQLALILDAEMLDLLYFHQIVNDELFVHSENVRQRPSYFDLADLRIGDLLYFEEMAEHVIDDDDSSDGAKHNFVEFQADWEAGQREACVFELFLIVEDEVLILFMSGFALDVVFLVADVLAVDWDEVNAVLDLHLHVEDLMLDHLLVVVAVFVADKQGKWLFFALETVVLVDSCLLLDQLDLVPSDVWFVLVSQLVLELDSDKHDQEPLVDNRVIIEIDRFDYFVLLVLILGGDS